MHPAKKVCTALFIALAFFVIPKADAQESMRRLGSIIVCTFPDDYSPMTGYKVYEWWGTAVPDYNWKLTSSVDAFMKCGEGKKCAAHKVFADMNSEQALKAQHKALDRSLRKKVQGWIPGECIVTGPDGKTVVSVVSVASLEKMLNQRPQ